MSVQKEIEAFVQKSGRVTFSKFMEMALFSASGGYYISMGNRYQKDYYTAPSVHPVFGSLLAIQLMQVWEMLGRCIPFYVVELGSGDGSLGNDLVSYAGLLSSEFAGAIKYLSLDYEFGIGTTENSQPVKTSGLPLRDFVGCVISNELVDSFPVHRFTIDGGRLKEIYVTSDAGHFREILGEPSTPRLEGRLTHLGLELPEGFVGEINLLMEDWIVELSQTIKCGLLLTFDYGFEACELYSDSHSMGTIRSYFRHSAGSDPYIRVGSQDITSHVDFTSLMSLGASNGFVNSGFLNQGQFLKNLGLNLHLSSLGRATMTQRERDRNRMAMLDLVKGDGMGAFKVLAQVKGLSSDTPLFGFDRHNTMLKGLPPYDMIPETPVLTEKHLDIMVARYPHLTWDWEELWPFNKDQ